MTQRIITYLAAHGQATRTGLTNGCFGGHVNNPMPTAAWINPPREQRRPTEKAQPCTVNL